MAIIVGDGVSGALVRLSGLRFIINLEGGLQRICSTSCSPNADGTDSIVDSLRGLRFDDPQADAFPHSRRRLANHTRAEQQCPQWWLLYDFS